jgi:hypothetical protein
MRGTTRAQTPRTPKVPATCANPTATTGINASAPAVTLPTTLTEAKSCARTYFILGLSTCKTEEGDEGSLALSHNKIGGESNTPGDIPHRRTATRRRQGTATRSRRKIAKVPGSQRKRPSRFRRVLSARTCPASLSFNFATSVLAPLVLDRRTPKTTRSAKSSFV